MGNYKYWNYNKTAKSTTSRLPINTHLVFEIDYDNNPGRMIIVDSVDRTKVYYTSNYGISWTQMDIDPSNTSGDQKSRDLDIQAGWHDKSNEKIYFADCDNDGSDTDFDVWYIDYSTWGSFSITEIGSSSASTLIYVLDIFKINTDTFVICQEKNICKVYDVDATPFIFKDELILWAYGFFGGGYVSGEVNVIDYIDIVSTSGNALDKGDLTQARYALGGVNGTIYGFFGGGSYSEAPTIYSNIIDYITLATTSGSALDKSDLTVGRSALRGVNGATYGFFGGGYDSSYHNTIDYITLATTSGNALDKGNLTVARRSIGSCNGSTYGFFGGGYNGSAQNVIDYITLATTSGNALDKGNLTVLRYDLAGVSGTTYGFFGGGDIGGYSDVIDYITLATTSGNALDKGNLSVARHSLAGVSGTTYGFFWWRLEWISQKCYRLY